MLISIYMLLTLVTGVSALWSGAIYAGIAGIVGPTLCWFATSGLKGSLMVGTPQQKVAGWGPQSPSLSSVLELFITSNPGEKGTLPFFLYARGLRREAGTGGGGRLAGASG